MPKITFRLGEIDRAIKEVKEYRNSLVAKADRLTRLLTEQGVSLAQLNASYMNIYDKGDLMNGIISRYDGKIGLVVSTAKHSVFCEFGTGVVGSGSPHPNVAILGWKYDINNHGELGWWYPADDGTYHWTAGMPSRPYMYETAKMLRQFIVPLAKEAFS